MFDNLINYPIESPLLRWESKVVVRNDDDEEKLFVRLKLTGTRFPLLDSIPFVRIGKVRAARVIIADDELSVNAYFDEPPRRGWVEFGYHDEALLRFPEPYETGRVELLDEKRLPRSLRYQERLLARAER